MLMAENKLPVFMRLMAMNDGDSKTEWNSSIGEHEIDLKRTFGMLKWTNIVC